MSNMFNFLFDGTIQKMGETVINYAAPIQSSTQQYQLAIQHHRNDEARHFIQSGQVQIGNIVDCGLADIHIACRFNNRLILELLLSQGLDINLVDKSGNTPLHYASKYGNIDVCRYLVGLNCLTGYRNSSGQSPYDVAESHIVRQYLLPLQFQEEAKHPDAIAQQQQPQDPFTIGGRSSVPTNVAPPPVFSSSASGISCSSQQGGGYPLNNRYVAYPGMEDNSSMQQNTSSAVPQYVSQGQPTNTPQPPAVQHYNPPTPSKVSHIIQPDGFGSSQTDVRLQQKYGNIKEQVYISPPPLGGTTGTTPNTPSQTNSVQPVVTNSVPIPETSVPPPDLPIPTSSSSAHLSSTLNNVDNSARQTASSSNSGEHSTPVVSTSSLPLPTPSSRSTAPTAHSPRAKVTTIQTPAASSSATESTVKPLANVVAPTPPVPPPAPSAATQMVSSYSSSSAIKPDGFGSSQTDVRLQQKYGNIKEQVYISPPPLGGMGTNTSTPLPLTSPGAPPNPHGVQQTTGHSVMLPPPPSMHQQQRSVPSSMPPLPYSAGSSQSQQSGVSTTLNDGSTFSTIDLDSNSSAMM